eukprot:5211028-Pleurochrysis_carterae.AAC.1
MAVGAASCEPLACGPMRNHCVCSLLTKSHCYDSMDERSPPMKFWRYTHILPDTIELLNRTAINKLSISARARRR